MFNALTGLGWGLVTFAVVIGIGSVVVLNIAGSAANCGVATETNTSAATYGSWNNTAAACQNITAQYAPTNGAYTNTNYLLTQLGTTGLAGWAPAIIAVAVGMLLLGAFMVGKGGNRSY